MPRSFVPVSAVGPRRWNRVRVCLNARRRKPGQFRQVFTCNIGSALGLGDTQPDTRCRKTRLGAVQFGVHSFFHTLGNCRLRFSASASVSCKFNKRCSHFASSA